MIGGVKARAHGLLLGVNTRAVASGPDGAAALVQFGVAEAPEAKGFLQVILKIECAREAGVAHQQPAQIHKLAISRLLGGQQRIHQVPITCIQRMLLLGMIAGGHQNVRLSWLPRLAASCGASWQPSGSD